MKLRLLLVLFLSGLTLNIFAQTKLPARLWVNRLPNNTGSSIRIIDLFTDASGNCYTIGYVDSTGTFKKGLIRKYSPAGALISEKRINASPSNYFSINNAVMDNAGNFYALVTRDSANNLSYQNHLVKIDNAGNIVWSKKLIRKNKPVFPSKLMIDASLNIYVGGIFSDPDNYFFGGKYNSSGDSIWTAAATAGVPSGWNAIFNCMDVDASGSIVVGGVLRSNDYRYGMYYAKFTNGSVVYDNGGVTISNSDYGILDIKFAPSGSVYFCGVGPDNSGFGKKFIVNKINRNGEGVWAYRPDTYVSSNEVTKAFALNFGNANEIFVAGTETTPNRNGINVPNTAFIKLDTNGNLIFKKYMADSCYANKMIKDNAGNYYIAGTSFSYNGNDTRTFLYDFNSKGQLLTSEIYWNPSTTYFESGFTYMTYSQQYGVFVNTSNGGNTNSVSTLYRYHLAVPVCASVIRSVNKPVTDFQTTYDTISFSPMPTNAQVVSISLKLDTLIHTWPSDVIATLTSTTTGRTDTLINRSGGNLLGDGFFNTVLNDSASKPIDSVYNPFTGTYKPYNPMYVFNQSYLNNQKFILAIRDAANGDNGTLKRWTLNVCYFDVSTVGVNSSVSNNLPDNFKLFQNYPNPFNPVCKISYQIPTKGFVELAVYDIVGKKVASLVNGNQEAGTHLAEFDGSALSSGVYFYKLNFGVFSETKKMLLVK